MRDSPGNVDDRTPLSEMTKGMRGKLFGDKGYISQELFEEFFERGLQLITGIRKSMKNKLMPLFDKIMLRKRSMIESINNQLKNVFQIEHTRHRSPINGLLTIITGLIAFVHHENKPSVSFESTEMNSFEMEF